MDTHRVQRHTGDTFKESTVTTTPSQKAALSQAIADGLTSVRLEGLEPDARMHADMAQLARGEIDFAEVERRVEARNLERSV